METRKIMFAVLALICAVSLAVTSCKDKKTQDKVNNRIENAKESVALEKFSDKMEVGADSVKEAWKETKEQVKEGADKAKKEIKEGYNNAKKEVKKTLD